MSKSSYIAGVFIILFASYAQYFFSHASPIRNSLLVYGLPITVISIISGKWILRRAFAHNLTALKYGMGAFGLFTLAASFAAAILFSILAKFDPSAMNLVNKANPVLRVPPGMAWVMVAASFLVIGPAEEYMFRGFVYGGLLRIYHDRHWFFLALISSLLFAAAHLYYLFIYGIASLAPFIEITAIGTALSVAYYYSGGNLVVPAIIHGLFDASGFIAADISPEAGLALRQFLLWAGVLSAFVLLAHRRRRKNKPADLRMPDPFFAEKGDHDE